MIIWKAILTPFKGEPKEAPLDMEGVLDELAAYYNEQGWPFFRDHARPVLERLYASGVKEGEERVLADPHLFHLRNDRP